MKLKRILAGAVAGIMALSLAACTSSASGSETTAASTGEAAADPTAAEETITVWTHYGEQNKDEMDYAYSKVKEKYPNVTLEFEDMPQDGNVAIKARAATGSLPDIMYLTGGLIDVLQKSNSLLVLDEYVAESNFKDELTEVAQKYCMTSPDGHIYVFAAAGVQPTLWYYNKTLFEENNIKVPTNYDELMDAVVAFNDLGITPMALWGKEPWPLGAFFDAFAMRENSQGVVALSTGEVTADAYTESINKIKALIDAGIFDDGMTNMDYETALALFQAGQAAMFQNGSWFIKDCPGAMNELSEDIDFFEILPTGVAGDTTNENCFSGGGDTKGYGVAASVNNPDLCADVARIIALAQSEYNFTAKGSPDVCIKTDDLQPETPLTAMGEKLVARLPSMTCDSALMHNLTNTEFSTGFFEEMQKLMVGESTEDFVANVNKLIEQSTAN